MFEHPKILVSYKKCFPAMNIYFWQQRIQSTAGCLVIDDIGDDDPVIILSKGDFFERLIKENQRTLEEQTCVTLNHEILHYILFKEQNIKACAKLDNIARSLREYGLW